MGSNAAGIYVLDSLGRIKEVTGSVGGGGGGSVGDLKNIKFIRKTADESVTSSTTLQNDDHFFLAISSNEVWTIEAHLFVTGGTTGDFQWAFNVPSGATGWNTGIRLDSNAITPTADVALSAIEDLTDTGFRVSGTASPTVHVQVNAIVINSSNSGNIQFRWAQNFSSATPTTIEAGSFMIFSRWT